MGEHTYYDWVVTNNLTNEERSKLNILFHLLSDKLKEVPFSSRYETRIRESVPEFIPILEAKEITKEAIYKVLQDNFRFSEESINQLFEGMYNQGNFKELANFIVTSK